MYKVFMVGDEITLWCEKNSMKWKRADDASTSERQDKEEEVDSTYQSLKEKHGGKYDNPKLRLWARMVTGGLLHDSLDESPDVPAF